MKPFGSLVRVQLLALLASLRVGTSRKQAASGWAALGLAGGLCLLISAGYGAPVAGQLAAAGQLWLLFVLMGGMALLMELAFTGLAAQGVVFGGRDAGLLLSMPVPALHILLAKLSALYLENLLMSLFFLLPCGGLWFWYGGGGGPLLWLRLGLGGMFLAMLPTVLALALGGALALLDSALGGRRAIRLLLYALAVIGLFWLGIRLNLGVSAFLAGALTGETVRLPGWTALLAWFARGVAGSWARLGLFALVCLAALLAAAGLLAGQYQRVLTGLSSHRRGPAYRLGAMRARSPLRALLRKEAARYFGTPIYLFNTGIGLVLLPAAGLAAVLFRDSLGGLLRALPAGMPRAVPAAAVVLFLLSTVAVSCSSVSLEGHSLWALREAPVSAAGILRAKALFPLLLSLPALLPGALGLSAGLGLGWAECAGILWLGGCFAAFNARMGVWINLLLPQLDAVSEMAVVKQSAAAMAGSFGGMGVALVCALALWRLSGVLGPAGGMAVCGAALLAGCAELGLWLSTKGAARLEAL